MNIKAIALGSVIALGSIFVGVPEAQARTCFDVPSTGGVICNTYEGSNGYGDVYRLGYSTGDFATGMTVTCRGSHVVDWKSNGNMSQSYTNTLAEYFCSI